MSLVVLATVYNEAKFLELALQSVVPHVDGLVAVEGAYQEVMKLGKPARSTDGTLDILKAAVAKWPTKFTYVEANEKSDPHQRNVALGIIKKAYPGATATMILDGDELYMPYQIRAASALAKGMNERGIDAYYFTCMTFVNDYKHYVLQQFPRLFRLYEDTEFINDNYVRGGGKDWTQITPAVYDMKYFHYGFVKGPDKFKTKKQWWNTRFGSGNFNYDWHLEEGQIVPENHTVYEYAGRHPTGIEKTS